MSNRDAQKAILAAYGDLIRVAAALATGKMLPDLPEGKRCGHVQIRHAVNDADRAHRLAAIQVRDAADALMKAARGDAEPSR